MFFLLVFFDLIQFLYSQVNTAFIIKGCLDKVNERMLILAKQLIIEVLIAFRWLLSDDFNISVLNFRGYVPEVLFKLPSCHIVIKT